LVTISGGQKPAVRIQANPVALSSYGINLEDLRYRAGQPALRSTRPRAVLMARRRTSRSTPTISLLSSDGYRDVVVAYKNGAPVMLTDVAKIQDGIENSKLAAWMNQTPAVIRQHPAAAWRQHNCSRRFG
jgi:multidrug efflux pump